MGIPKRVFISILIGLIAGTMVSAFLYALNFVTEFRETHLWILWLLPFGGLATAWFYQKFQSHLGLGMHQVLDEITQPKRSLYFMQAPGIFLFTLVTHVLGGSAGREGTALQMSASLSDQVIKIFKNSESRRSHFLRAACGAGFTAALGTPWAGAVFGIEFTQIGAFAWSSLLETAAASWAAFLVTQLLRAPHSDFGSPLSFEIDLQTILGLITLGILLGFTARIFTITTSYIHKKFPQLIKSPLVRGVLVGGLLALAFQLFNLHRYAGLGIPVIQDSLLGLTSVADAPSKFFFTVLTLAGGFKGGEFIPLVFIGTTLTCLFSLFVPLISNSFVVLGFGALFGAAAQAPLACSLMIAELFGWNFFVQAFVVCWASYYVSGLQGLYGFPKILTQSWTHKIEFLIRAKAQTKI